MLKVQWLLIVNVFSELVTKMITIMVIMLLQLEIVIS